MSFLIRAARIEDINPLVDLAKQFSLLNLPGDKKVITRKVEKSIESFTGELSKADSEYLFVVEDREEETIVGSSLVMAKHGTEETPHSYIKIFKRNLYSDDLGIGFIHQVLRFQMDFDGPTEIGGLLVDRAYRGRPEKLGKQISLSRFVYMGMYPERFEKRVLCELTPPLTEEGRSEFWEALGRRFTGLPYQEADLISQSHKEFIASLFPQEDIYLCLLDPKARLVLGRVGEQTKPAQHLLESIGFDYIDEVDPFDGGPHYGVNTEDILPIKFGQKAKVVDFKDSSFKTQGLVGVDQDEFRCVLASYDIRDGEVALTAKAKATLEIENGQEVFVTPFNYNTKKGRVL